MLADTASGDGSPFPRQCLPAVSFLCDGPARALWGLFSKDINPFLRVNHSQKALYDHAGSWDLNMPTFRPQLLLWLLEAPGSSGSAHLLTVAFRRHLGLNLHLSLTPRGVCYANQ